MEVVVTLTREGKETQRFVMTVEQKGDWWEAFCHGERWLSKTSWQLACTNLATQILKQMEI